MRPLILVLTLLLLAPDVAADPVLWADRRVPVFDHTRGAWRPLVQSLVAQFNATLPKSAPRLRYRAQPERVCSAIRPHTHKRGIVICPIDGEEPWFGQTTPMYDFSVRPLAIKRMRIAVTDIRLADFPPEVWQQTLCHELMHAVTNIRDDLTAPQPAMSCVYGYLDHPGPFDAQYARRVYRQFAHKARHHRRHAR